MTLDLHESHAGATVVRPRRAVVYIYTQTGQLREVVGALTDPLTAKGWDVRWVGVQPMRPFPFPWPLSRFFAVFAQAVNPVAEVDLVEPVGGFAAAGELVVLAYQVWYLAPSLPMRSLLRTHPEAVRGRDVVSVIARRNMWYSAAVEMSELLCSAGARSVQVVATTDTRGSVTTLVTTLRWLLTGRREPFLWFRRAGVGDDEMQRVAALALQMAVSGSVGTQAAPIVPALAATDLLAGVIFRRWAAMIRPARRVGPAADTVALIPFVLVLAIGIVVVLPAITLAALIAGDRFASAVSDFVYRRINFDRSHSTTEANA